LTSLEQVVIIDEANRLAQVVPTSQNFELVKGWVNERKKNWVIKLYCHFENMTHSNSED
jgi:hypothetical protein